MMNYAEFLAKKAQRGADKGFAPRWLPDFLFDFQAALVDWSIRKGRDAIFADCGLGKTPMELVWAQNVVEETNGRVLILTPLAFAQQTIGEAEKFGIEAVRSSGHIGGPGIYVANYERLHHFDAKDFVGVACDESSILKSFDGARRGEITEFMRKVLYRLLATATAAPNDYIELGTSSEALGYLGHMDMLNRFFKNDLNNSATGRMRGEVIKWRLKGHAEVPFWRWVCSWARAIRRPSDLGFDDRAFILPPLNETEHLVEAESLADGMLFAMPAVGLKEQREERRRTVREQAEARIAELTLECANLGIDNGEFQLRAEKAEALSERFKQEAQIHAQETRTANSTIAEIYQICTGSTGEPGNWYGAAPVRDLKESRDQWKANFEQAEAECERLRKDAERYRWLRDPARIPHDADIDGHMIVGPGCGEDIYWTTQLDAAIDNAKLGEKG